MDSTCPLANSAIIQGLLKYKKFDSALEFYESAKVKKIKLSVGVYNSLLSECKQITSSGSKIKDFVLDTLKEMAKANVSPNLGTLNAALKSLSRINQGILAQALIAEFLKLGIEPSLGSYGYLFQIWRQGKFEMSRKNIIEVVMQHIENKEHEIRHPSDLEFFTNAMDTFAAGSHCEDFAKRLINMYLKPDNMKFVVRGCDENALFKQFLLLIFKTEPIDVAMDVYRRFVYTRFCPESKVVSAMIAAVHENLSSEYLVQLWENINLMGFSRNRPILGRLLALVKDFPGEASLKVFHRAASNFLEKLSDFKPGDEGALPLLILVFVKNDDTKRIVKALDCVEANITVVDMPENIAETLLEYAISKKDVPLITKSVKVASLLQLNSTSEMAKKALPLLSGDDEVWASGLITERKDGRAIPDERNASDLSQGSSVTGRGTDSR